MKVLFTTPVLEHPAAGGPQLRIENSIKALSKVNELYVVSRNTKQGIGGEDAEQFYRGYCKQFLYSPSALDATRNRYWRLIKAVYRKVTGSRFNDLDFILNIVKEQNIDVIWFGYGNISFPLIKRVKQVIPDIKVVCDTDSVWSRFILRELPYEDDPERRCKIEKEGKEKELEERAWVNLCEVTAAVSEIDAIYYREIAQEPDRVKIFSNVIDLDTYAYVPAPPSGFKKPCVYLAGTFWPKSPMEKAARWIITDVLPVVKQSIPDVHFYVVGRGSQEVLSDINDQNITITGKLPTVLPFLCNANVAIVPLKFESGTRFKILEAGACNIPIVSTTLGAEGIPVVDGKDIILADEPEQFAAGIIKIINDKEFGAQLAKNCWDLIQKQYSVEFLAREAQDIFDYLKDK
jgi:glycosyltransferase involved in cell wall biosynthesis